LFALKKVLRTADEPVGMFGEHQFDREGSSRYTVDAPSYAMKTC
jgi:hypothetical protein